MANDVIAAIATPRGRGGIGIVRISGPRLDDLLNALIGVEVVPRRASRVDFVDAGGGIIDQGLVLYFPAPHSYTGEDVVELQGHGGPVVMQMLLNRCLQLGARIAAPGEFTRRAFLNDRLDLAQAEGVADLIDAATAEAARCALRSLNGEFSQRIDLMVHALIELRMLVEATLDFPEEDIESLTQAKARAQLAGIREQLAQILVASRQGSLLREGIRVVLAGAPNVGKSSLMNRIAGADVAIVTDLPGTTRDTIRETISVQGIPLMMIDTAGLREPHDPVEKIGISRTWKEMSNADLVLWVGDASRAETWVNDPKLLQRLPESIPQLQIINKTDLTDVSKLAMLNEILPVSAKTGAGIEALKTAMLKAVGWGGSGEGIYLARERHIEALQNAGRHLDAAFTYSNALELFAEELKLAQNALGSITGEFTSDDLLGQIFSRFCIGK